jgi:hypothetical protein
MSDYLDLLRKLRAHSLCETPDTIDALIAIYDRNRDPGEAEMAIDYAQTELRFIASECDGMIRVMRRNWTDQERMVG